MSDADEPTTLGVEGPATEITAPPYEGPTGSTGPSIWFTKLAMYAASLITLAERLPTGSYRLTGRKAYITNASYGDFGIVLATGLVASVIDPDEDLV